MSEPLIIALAKGRILDEALPLLASCGIRPLEDQANSRKLIQDTTDPGFRLVVVRSDDVPTYVRLGAADVGIVGKDVLAELEDAGGIDRSPLVMQAHRYCE